MGHVAVVAFAAGRIGKMVGVLSELCPDLFVALQAGLVASHAFAELVVFPFPDGVGAPLAFVKGVAAHAGDGLFRIRVAVSVAGAVDEPAVFPPRDSDDSVGPVPVGEIVRFVLGDVLDRLGVHILAVDDFPGSGKVISGAVGVAGFPLGLVFLQGLIP